MLAHSAAVVLQHLVPCFWHLPFLSTSPEDLQQESTSGNSSARYCHHCWLSWGGCQTPVVLGAGLGHCLPIRGPVEKRWWGQDKAQSLTLLCPPSTSDGSQISPNLRPPASKFTFPSGKSCCLPQSISHRPG